MSEEGGLGKRIATRIPTHMPELQRELDKFPENFQSKRLLNLAYMGLLVAQNETITALVDELVRQANENLGKPAQRLTPTVSVHAQPAVGQQSQQQSQADVESPGGVVGPEKEEEQVALSPVLPEVRERRIPKQFHLGDPA